MVVERESDVFKNADMEKSFECNLEKSDTTVDEDDG